MFLHVQKYFEHPADGTKIDLTFIGFFKHIFNFVEVKNTIKILQYLRIFLLTNKTKLCYKNIPRLKKSIKYQQINGIGYYS